MGGSALHFRSSLRSISTSRSLGEERDGGRNLRGVGISLTPTRSSHTSPPLAHPPLPSSSPTPAQVVPVILGLHGGSGQLFLQLGVGSCEEAELTELRISCHQLADMLNLCRGVGRGGRRGFSMYPTCAGKGERGRGEKGGRREGGYYLARVAPPLTPTPLPTHTPVTSGALRPAAHGQSVSRSRAAD